MEASAVHAPALSRLTLSPPLLRLRSDEQLVALFRAGSEDAFGTIHERYRQRLFAYVRQMMSSGSKSDAEDVLQDVFVRAYGALRADTRDLNLRAWLYRVAHNRCIDHLRRPTPVPSDVFEMSRTPLHDPMETAQRREDLQRLVADVGRLPDQQRSALLMREIDGLAYADIADALEVTVPAVKSLLVRARVGLAEAAEARDTACVEIRADLAAAYDRGVKASGRARKHMRECSGCAEYRTALRGMRRSFAALSPVGAVGPIAMIAQAFGIGGAGGGVAVGGGAGAAGSGVAAATACKVAAVVCTAAITAGGAVEVQRLTHPDPAPRPAAAAKRAPKVSSVAAAAAVPAAVTADVILKRTDTATPASRPAPGRKAARKPAAAEVAPIVAAPPAQSDDAITETTGGAVAPAADAPAEDAVAPPVDEPSGSGTSGGDGGSTAPEQSGQQPGGSTDPAASGGTPPGSGPPTEH